MKRQPWLRAIPFLVVALLYAFAGCSDNGGDGGGGTKGGPEIERIVAVPAVVARGGQTLLTALASDPDGDSLTYHWTAEAGTLSNQVRARIRWTAPAAAGTYRITVQVTSIDGNATHDLDIMVGSGAIRVTSTPAGAGVFLNASLQAGVTPVVYKNLPAGDYNVEVSSAWFLYNPPAIGVTVVDGETVDAVFTLAPVKTEVIDTGNEGFDEIGAFTYTEEGLGVVFTTKSGAATTLRSASLLPVHQGMNGQLLASGLTHDEPVAFRLVPFGSELAFVVAGDIMVGRIIDSNIDGLIERLDGVRRLNGLAGNGYAPAFDATGSLMSFSLMPSTPPNGSDLILEGKFDSASVSDLHRISSRNGNSPSYDPNGSIVFESAGELYRAYVDTLNPQPAIQLTHTGGHAFAPAVSPTGDYIAYIDDRGRLEVFVPARNITTTLKTDVRSGRVCWAPNQRELVIADNAPGGPGHLLLISELPFP